MARESPARVDVYFEDFLAGMFDLSLEERGAYWTFCCLLWKHKGRLPANEAMLARWCGCSARLLRSVRDALIEKGKITVEDGFIRQFRAETEWNASVSRLESAVKKGRTGAEKKAEIRTNPQNGHDTGSSSAPSSAPPSGSSHPHLHRQESESLPSDSGSSPPAGAREEPQTTTTPGSDVVSEGTIAEVFHRLETIGATIASIRRDVDAMVRVRGSPAAVEDALRKALCKPGNPLNYARSIVRAEALDLEKARVIATVPLPEVPDPLFVAIRRNREMDRRNQENDDEPSPYRGLSWEGPSGGDNAARRNYS